MGIELEVNQRYVVVGGGVWQGLRADIVESLANVLAPGKPQFF